MKKTIRIYINTLLLFLIPFTLISLILAILSYFMQINATVLELIIQVLSYAFLILSAFYFTSQINQKRISHCLCLSLIYFLVSLLIHLGNLNYIHLFIKSILFMVIGLYKELRNHHLNV